MANRRKRKGNKAERGIAEVLTEWWGKVFKRLPNSGGLRWNGIAWTYSDIFPPEDFRGVIESKHYKHIDTDALIRLPASKDRILGWWEQTRGDAARCYAETKIPAHPLLIYKKNNVPRRLVMEAGLYAAIGGRKLMLPTLWVTLPDYAPFVVVDLAQFLAVVDREMFIAGTRMLVPAALVEPAA